MSWDERWQAGEERPGAGADAVLPVLFGLLAGLAVALLGLFTLGRLTITTLGSAGAGGRLTNAVLGAALAAAIGAVAARFAVRGARTRDLDEAVARRSGLIAGIVAVLLTVGVGLTTPLHPVITVLELGVGWLATWWTVRRSAHRART